MRDSHSDHPAFDRLQAILDGPADNPWVFGVCGNLARRNDWPVWGVRAAMLLALIVLTFPTLVCYLTFGLAMDKTNARTKRLLRQWCVVALRGIQSLINRLQGKRPEPRDPLSDY